jgi:membrane-bound metal-dependent hydrolase YbcI (DUF457 family)
MPNRDMHLHAGAITGAFAALVMVQGEADTLALAEIAGGLIGGALGGLAPDLLEPATSPHHRKLAHSMVTAGALTLAKVAEWQAGCRRNCAGHTARASTLPPGSTQRRDAEASALMWSIAAGLIVGFASGYASHLALDAATSRSLPLLGL